jgi:hypothetical protein
MNIEMDEIKDLLKLMLEMMRTTHEKIDSLERKIDKLEIKMNEDVLVECKKMGTHIDFVENVYENVKHPLGYICSYLTNKQSSLQIKDE